LKDRLRAIAEGDAAMIDEMQPAGLIEAREQVQLREGRPATPVQEEPWPWSPRAP
jgi:hypothetical protein